MTNEKISAFAELVKKSFDAGTLKNLVFSKPLDKEVLKIKATVKTNGAKRVLSFEYAMTEGRVKQKNATVDELIETVVSLSEGFNQIDLNDNSGSASLLKSKSGKVTLLTKGKIGEGERVQIKSEEKQYILSGAEQFLVELGISDKSGRVHDKRQAKYRQINRFIEHIRDASEYLPAEGDLRIADLCCGKSYLSFAVYYYFSVICNREVTMDCMDLKKSVMDECSAIAKKCGFDGMHFAAGDVNGYMPDKAPHLVISLHACDVATDIVLDKAAAICADVILATPCCHRQLSRDFSCEALSFISDNAVLKYKLCDAATDALRVLRLKAMGYCADAVEMIDPDETPKNVLIRAHKNKRLTYKNVEKANAEKYREAYKYLCGKDAPDFPEIVF